MKNLVILITASIIALPCAGQDVVSLGVDPDTGLEEIRVNLPGLPEGAKPLEMVLIPAGTFTMGSPASERRRRAWDWLPHEVTISTDFYLAKYEVTQAQWEAVMGSNPARNYGVGVGDGYPVYYVSWNDCQAFIEKLNGMGLGTIRLPTEAEWEYACRAGTTTRFSFGDALECDDVCGYCEIFDQYMWWCGNNSPSGTKEVGLKLPNPWGLYDMHGNVWEWCSDWWQDPYHRGPQVDPTGQVFGSSRVVRGGSWLNIALFSRSALRYWPWPGYTSHYIGFRVVVSSLTTPVTDWTLR